MGEVGQIGQMGQMGQMGQVGKPVMANSDASALDLHELATPPSATEALIAQRINAHIDITQQLQKNTALFTQVAECLTAAFASGHKLLLCGNGGSAADAQHIAAEFVGKFYFDRPALPAEALSTNTSSVTAIGNDYSFDTVFSRQVEAFGAAGDVCIGISTSGNSRNIIEAFRAARAKSITTIALTGADGGAMKAEADYCVCIPSTDTPRIQEHHILIGHILCELVEQTLFGDSLVGARAAREAGLAEE